MLDDCGQDINISAVHVHACVYVFRGSIVEQVPTVSNSAMEQPHSHCRSTVRGEYHCYSFGTDEDRRGIHCIDSTSQLSPYVKTLILRYFPHETPKERPKTKHKQLCEMVGTAFNSHPHFTGGGVWEVEGGCMGAHAGVTCHPEDPHCMHYCALHMRLTSHDIGGLTKTSSSDQYRWSEYCRWLYGVR